MKQIIDPHQGVVHVHQIAIRAVGLYAGQVSQNGVGIIVLQPCRQLQPESGYFTDDEKSIMPSLLIERHENPADRKSTRLNSSHVAISYAVFCLKKKKK